MENVEYKKIGEVLSVERGGSPRPIDAYITEDPDGINWIKIGDADDSMYISHTQQKIKPSGMKKSRFVHAGDFLLSNSMSFGRPYILAIDGCIHDGWLVLHDERNLFDKRFLYYYLSAPSTYNRFKQMAVGGVVNNLNSEMVRNVSVPLPSLNVQQRIADTLDKVTEGIAICKQMLSDLDALVKSRFVEMFGKYENSDKVTTINDISEMVTVGIANSATQAYSEDGIIMFRNQNIKDGYLDDSDLIFITTEFAEKYKTKSLMEDDILVTRTGYPGVACLVPSKYAGCQTFTTLILRLKKTGDILPSYVCDYINSKYGKEFVENMKVGVAQQNFGAKALAQMPIFIPCIEEQQAYADFVTSVNATKNIVKNTLDESQLLLASLMQKYFG